MLNIYRDIEYYVAFMEKKHYFKSLCGYTRNFPFNENPTRIMIIIIILSSNHIYPRETAFFFYRKGK